MGGKKWLRDEISVHWGIGVQELFDILEGKVLSRVCRMICLRHQFLVCRGGEIIVEEVNWVNFDIVVADLIVEVRTGRQTGTS